MGQGTNPNQGFAGGAMPSQPAGQPIAYNFGGPQIPGNPGNIWGQGSTFYAPQTGSSLSPEIINAQGNAYLYGPNGWTPAGTNARPPTSGPPPTAPYAGPNSTPGAPLSPYLSQSSVQQLEQQLAGDIATGRHGAIHPPTPQAISSTLGSFFGNLPQTVAGQAPAGGYIPGYAIPQNSIQYVPGSSVAGLTKQLEANPLKNSSQINSIVGNWASGLGSLGPTGVSVPTLGSSSTGSSAKK